MSSEFIPRLGKTVFACRFCGCEPLQWTEIAPEKWMPFDLVKREMHQCWNITEDILNRDSVLKSLHAIGFKSYTPRTRSWKYAFIANNDTHTLYFLVGKRSIDFKLYDQLRKTMFDEKGYLFTDGGIMVRNYYHESDVNIHELILEIATRFVANLPICESFLSGHGKSMKEVKKELHTKIISDQDESARNDTKDMYEAISSDDGVDAYLGDGIWISSNGNLDDRG